MATALPAQLVFGEQTAVHLVYEFGGLEGGSRGAREALASECAEFPVDGGDHTAACPAVAIPDALEQQAEFGRAGARGGAQVHRSVRPGWRADREGITRTGSMIPVRDQGVTRGDLWGPIGLTIGWPSGGNRVAIGWPSGPERRAQRRGGPVASRCAASARSARAAGSSSSKNSRKLPASRGRHCVKMSASKPSEVSSSSSSPD